MLPTSFSLRLYCGEPARAPSHISFALLLVDAPHLVLSAVVLRRACSRSLAHFLRAPPGRCSPPRSLCSCTAESLLALPRAFPSRSSWSMLPTSFSLQLYCGQPARAPSRISFTLLLVLTFLALFPCAPLGRWLLTGSLRVIL